MSIVQSLNAFKIVIFCINLHESNYSSDDYIYLLLYMDDAMKSLKFQAVT